MRMTATYLGEVDWNGIPAHRWRCTLSNEGHTWTTHYHKGLAHKASDTPTMGEVLRDVLADVQVILDSKGFDDWCRHYGYDATDRAAEHEWQALVTQARRVRDLLGDPPLA